MGVLYGREVLADFDGLILLSVVFAATWIPQCSFILQRFIYSFHSFISLSVLRVAQLPT